MWLQFFILFWTIIYIIYRWATKHYDYFDKKGLPYKKPTFFFGVMRDVILKRKTFLDMIIDIYNEHDAKVYGVFDQRQPVIVLRDPELIKQITIKDFDHFVNHRNSFADDNDNSNLFSLSLFMMKDDRWKNMRNTLSPAFTGSKMRIMFQLIEQVAHKAVNYMNQQLFKSNNQSVEVDIKDLITRFTNDVIATTAFGLEMNSFEQKKNQFYMAGKKLSTFGFWQSLKFFLYQHMKIIMKVLRIELFDKSATKYFMQLVLDAIQYREKHGIIRPDMINMLMQARNISKSPENINTHNHEWNDADIVAQCFIFFFAGFETTASLISFMAYEIMANPDVQKKLVEEICNVEAKFPTNNEITYESVQSMPYMDMVLSETLRKWGGALVMDRVCTKDISYNLDNGLQLNLNKGDCLWIPAAGLHYDPKYFPNPTKFDPERFSRENKEYIKPFTYMPFGLGPRNCIGFRFAQLESKVFIYHLLRKFRLERSKKSIIPIELKTNGFQLMPKGGFHIKIIERN